MEMRKARFGGFKGKGMVEDFDPLEEDEEMPEDEYDLMLYNICKRIAVVAKEIRKVQRFQNKIDKYIKQQERQEKQMLRWRKE